MWRRKLAGWLVRGFGCSVWPSVSEVDEREGGTKGTVSGRIVMVRVFRLCSTRGTLRVAERELQELENERSIQVV